MSIWKWNVFDVLTSRTYPTVNYLGLLYTTGGSPYCLPNKVNHGPRIQWKVRHPAFFFVAHMRRYSTSRLVKRDMFPDTMADVRAALPLPYRAIPCSQMFSVIDPNVIETYRGCLWLLRCVVTDLFLPFRWWHFNPSNKKSLKGCVQKLFEHFFVDQPTWMVHIYGKLVGNIYQSHGSTLTPSTACCFYDHWTTQYQGLCRWCLDGGACFFGSILVGDLKKIPIPFFVGWEDLFTVLKRNDL